MIDEDVYTFKIDAYSPDTIPMARLAEYMAELAAIFGERDRVHFQGLQPGSTNLLSRVEREAAPKVRDNVAEAASGASEPVKRLNEMLRKDNADGQLARGDDNVLAFPGKHMIRPPKLGPFNQGIVKDGVLIRIGGADKSAHAIIEDGSGRNWSFEVTRELARELAHHLFGKPLRLTGHGRWYRDEEGQWQYTVLKALGFQQLDDSTLAEVVSRIRGLQQDTWKQGTDPMEMLRALRDEGGAPN